MDIDLTTTVAGIKEGSISIEVLKSTHQLLVTKRGLLAIERNKHSLNLATMERRLEQSNNYTDDEVMGNKANIVAYNQDAVDRLTAKIDDLTPKIDDLDLDIEIVWDELAPLIGVA